MAKPGPKSTPIPEPLKIVLDAGYTLNWDTLPKCKKIFELINFDACPSEKTCVLLKVSPGWYRNQALRYGDEWHHAIKLERDFVDMFDSFISLLDSTFGLTAQGFSEGGIEDLCTIMWHILDESEFKNKIYSVHDIEDDFDTNFYTNITGNDLLTLTEPFSAAIEKYKQGPRYKSRTADVEPVGHDVEEPADDYLIEEVAELMEG